MDEIPKADKFDLFEKTLTTVIANFSSLGPLLALIIPTELEKRKTKWLEEFGNRVKNLEDKVGIIESEENLTLFFKASSEAMRTHKREKLKQLADVLFGLYVDQDIVFDRKDLILDLTIELEPTDIFILNEIAINQQIFAKIESLLPLYEHLKRKGYSGLEDEFIHSLNKLDRKVLIQRQTDLRLAEPSPNRVVWAGGPDVGLPAIAATPLGFDLIRRICFDHKIRG